MRCRGVDESNPLINSVSVSNRARPARTRLPFPPGAGESPVSSRIIRGPGRELMTGGFLGIIPHKMVVSTYDSGAVGLGESMPPMFREGRSKRSWRREVAAGLVQRVDGEGEVRFVGTHPADRAEMLRIAEILPDDIIAELYEDPAFPGCTFMELSLGSVPVAFEEPNFNVVYPEGDSRASGL